MPLVVLMLAVTVAYIERTAIAHIVPYILASGSYGSRDMALVLSAFGIGYVLGLPFSGMIIDRFGYRKTLSFIAVGWSASSVGFVLSDSLFGLVGFRLLLGLFEAPLFPLFVSWIALASPSRSVPLRIGLVEACSYLGMACAGPVTVFLANDFGWRASYALIGVLSLGILGLAPLLGPAVRAGQVPDSLRGSSGFGMAALAMAIGFLFYNFCKNFYSTWFPTFLVRGFDYTSVEAAQLTFVQSLMGPLASISAALISIALVTRQVPVRYARLAPITLGFLLGSLLIAIPAFPAAIAPVAIISFVGIISTSALIWNMVPDLADPARIGHVAGWVNAIANLGTFANPLVIGSLIASGYDLAMAAVGVTCLLAIPAFAFSYLAGSKGQGA